MTRRRHVADPDYIPPAGEAEAEAAARKEPARRRRSKYDYEWASPQERAAASAFIASRMYDFVGERAMAASAAAISPKALKEVLSEERDRALLDVALKYFPDWDGQSGVEAKVARFEAQIARLKQAGD
jgi:hypothetical protein